MQGIGVTCSITLVSCDSAAYDGNGNSNLEDTSGVLPVKGVNGDVASPS